MLTFGSVVTGSPEWSGWRATPAPPSATGTVPSSLRSSGVKKETTASPRATPKVASSFRATPRTRSDALLKRSTTSITELTDPTWSSGSTGAAGAW